MATNADPVNAGEILSGWIERNLNGKVTRIERVPRWRACWNVDLEKDGEIVPLYIKGGRGSGLEAPGGVRKEAAIYDVMVAHGLKAPRTYGYCSDLDCVVVERLSGKIRPSDGDDPAEWVSVLYQYVDQLAALHRIDPQAFISAGVGSRYAAKDMRLAQVYEVEEVAYLPRKSRPEPALEFMRLWARRNVPKSPFRPSFVTGDSFQLMYDKGKLTGFIDLEMGLIGDPMHDLACLLIRSISEPTTDFSKLCRRYAEASGEPLDLDAILFLQFTMALMSALYCVPPKSADRDYDYHEYYCYYIGGIRQALEGMADMMSLSLDPFAEPDPPPQFGGDLFGLSTLCDRENAGRGSRAAIRTRQDSLRTTQLLGET